MKLRYKAKSEIRFERGAEIGSERCTLTMVFIRETAGTTQNLNGNRHLDHGDITNFYENKTR